MSEYFLFYKYTSNFNSSSKLQARILYFLLTVLKVYCFRYCDDQNKIMINMKIRLTFSGKTI